MTLIKNKWFRVLLTYIGCSLCWILDLDIGKAGILKFSPNFYPAYV